MTSAWDRAQQLADEHAKQGGVFARLQNDGDKIVVAFCGDPFAREVVWTGERYEEYDDNKPEHEGLKRSLRVMLNVYVPADKAMKVMEGGTTWFKGITKVRDKYGLDSWTYEIERQGAAGDPKTKYVILPETKVDAELQAEIEHAQLNDLAALAAGSNDSGTTSGSGALSQTQINTMVARLKGLPKSDVQVFLGQLEISRVRDLPPADLPAAETLLTKLEAAHEQPAQQQEEIDPFA